MQGLSYIYPEDRKVGCVEVTGRDLMTLGATEFVNDTIMDYYTMWLKQQYAQAFQGGTTQAKIHFFSAFFYKKFTEKNQHEKIAVCIHASGHLAFTRSCSVSL